MDRNNTFKPQLFEHRHAVKDVEQYRQFRDAIIWIRQVLIDEKIVLSGVWSPHYHVHYEHAHVRRAVKDRGMPVHERAEERQVAQLRGVPEKHISRRRQGKEELKAFPAQGYHAGGVDIDSPDTPEMRGKQLVHVLAA
ncbi:hypothetical protein EWM64_g4404 [Hericium alpestre]|uniref:Uncharacterized protein n=1 Tax=Hericium alpestre TaxID=135208 RepID=A0A4Z0A093_9AGAM|nr:hypothetical protein EWM64_g4404 [Hericium alpestre]